VNSVLNIQVKILASQARSVLAQLNTQMLGLGSLGPANNNIARVGSQMQWLGRQLEYNFTLPILAAGTAATKFALDNEKAFTRITKVYGDAAHGSDFYAKELESLRKAFIALSNEFGVAQDDALNIAADWAAAGASGLALAKSVELTLKTMVLGELQASDATNSLIAIQAQYGLSISQLSDTIDILNMVENQTGISMGGLIAGFARVAGVARASGVGVRELAADLAALTPATGSAANAGNALKTIFSRLLSPTKDAAEVLKLMGINVNSFAWQSSNAQERLLTMSKTFGTLSDAQKGFVSSIIASRYQVNRFEQLMVELSSSTGYYQRALQSTKDMNAVYTQSQKELNQVLTSNPQRLKIIWTMLQNASADIIQPLIPLVLWLASAIQNLVTAFSNLNPGLQKFILFGLAFVALVGPVIRYAGALVILFSQLSGLVRLIIGPFRVLIGLFGLGGTAVKSFFTLFSYGFRLLSLNLFTFFFATVPRLFRSLFPVFAVISRVGFGILQVIWSAGAQAMATGMSFGMVLARNVFRGTYLFFTVGSRLLWTNMVLIFRAGSAAVYTTFLTRFVGPVAAAAGVLWRTMLLGPVAFFRGLGVILASGFRAIIPFLARMGLVIFDVLTGPWGIAITAIIILIAIFWKDLKQIWTNIVNWFRGNNNNFASAFKPLADAVIAVKNLVIRAFNALPVSIRNAMIAVVDVIAAAAKAVYKWFSYLNPWAKHSPSLIDNVKTGAEAIKGHYSSTQDHTDNMRKASVAASTVHASGVNNAAAVIQNQTAAVQQVGQSFNSVTDDVDKFEQAIAKVQRAAEEADYANIRKQLQDVAAGAVPAFDQLIKDLYPLEDQLKVVGKQLDAQKAIVDGLKDSLGAANDALDAQTKILDGMKDSMSGLDDQIASLNGGLEVLRGSREQLRQAGAGSDILGNYDAQIQQLQDQKNGINDQLQAAQTAYNQQKTLVDQLTASRDALQASYDLESKKLDQIQKQYDAIRDKISAITDAINSFKSAADSLASAKGGKNDLIGDQFKSGAGANFADVGGAGGLGREGGIEDQSKLIDDFTKSIQDKTKNLFGLFNFLDPIKKAWGVAWKWVADTFGPIVALIGNFFSHLFDNVPNPFAGNGGRFKEWFEAVAGFVKFLTDAVQQAWKLIGPPILEIANIIKEKLGKAFQEIGPELAQYKDLIEPIGDVLKNYVLPILKIAAGVLIGVFLLALNIVLHVLKNTLPPVWDAAIGVIKNFIKFFRGIAELFYGIITGRWSLALKGLKDIFLGIFGVIWSALKGAVLLIIGVIKGLVEGIVTFFQWVYDVLVGHSIIPDLVKGIIKWFQFLADVVKAIWNAFGTALSWIWDNIIKPIVDKVKESFKAIADVVAVMVDEVKKRWQIFKDGYAALWDVVKQVAGWIRDKFNEMRDGISNAISTAKGYIDQFITKVTGIKDQLKNAFVGVFDGLKDAFKSAVNWIIGKWNDLSFGVGPFKADTPDIPFLASGGMVANKATAIVGEGRRGYPEYVIPTDPVYRTNALALFNKLGEALGIGQLLSSGSMLGKFGSLLANTGNRLQFFAGGGVFGRARLNSRMAAAGGSIIMAPTVQNTTNHFHGNLEFPNVKDGKDAKEFVKNLKALVG